MSDGVEGCGVWFSVLVMIGSGTHHSTTHHHPSQLATTGCWVSGVWWVVDVVGGRTQHPPNITQGVGWWWVVVGGGDDW